MSEVGKRVEINPIKYIILKGDGDIPLIPILVKYLPLISIMKLVCIEEDKGPRPRFCSNH